MPHEILKDTAQAILQLPIPSSGDPIMDLLGSAGLGGALVYTAIALLKAYSARKDKQQDIEALDAESARKDADAARSEYRTVVMNRLEAQSKALSDLFETQRGNADNFKEGISAISKAMEAIVQKVEAALQSGADDLSTNGVRNHFGIWAGKLHYEIYLWYLNRVRENHILSEPDEIGLKYSDMLGSILGRWRAQLETYKSRGELMLAWDPDLEGLSGVYRKLFNRLYQDQVATASGKAPYFKDPLVELDHIQSRLMRSVGRWASGRKPLVDDLDDTVSAQIGKRGIEFLNDNFSKEMT